MKWLEVKEWARERDGKMSQLSTKRNKHQWKELAIITIRWSISLVIFFCSPRFFFLLIDSLMTAVHFSLEQKHKTKQKKKKLILVYISRREDVIKFHSLLNTCLVSITQRGKRTQLFFLFFSLSSSFGYYIRIFQSKILPATWMLRFQ